MFHNRCNDIDTVLLLQSCQVVRIFRISYGNQLKIRGVRFHTLKYGNVQNQLCVTSYGPISDRICMFTCTRNHLVSGLLYFWPLSRYALYYYIMAENHVAEKTKLVYCV